MAKNPIVVFKNLPKNQKAPLVFLVLFTVVFLIFGFWQFHYNINSPFIYKASSGNELAVATSTPTGNSEIDYKNPPDPNSLSLDQLQTLRSADNDSDGLSDYDELYVYGTSPYLEDSDGDNYNDYQEIINHTDPNCPVGKTCDASTVVSGATTPASSTIISTLPLSNNTSTLSATSEAVLQGVLNGTTEPAVLRKLLLENGLDKATLDKISDEDLLRSYQESIQR